MPEYTIEVTVKVSADTIHEAYGYIREACRWARKAEITYVDAEVIDTFADYDGDNEADNGQ